MRNPNAECRMPKEARNPKSEQVALLSGFGFGISFVIRHSSFVIPILATL
jgi:hypothetical protein